MFTLINETSWQIVRKVRDYHVFIVSFVNFIYYTASSVSGQDESNPAL